MTSGSLELHPADPSCFSYSFPPMTLESSESRVESQQSGSPKGGDDEASGERGVDGSRVRMGRYCGEGQ